MTNDDVIALAQAGLPAEIITAKIRSAGSTKFDTSVTGLKALMAAKVPTAVIQVMIAPAAGTSTVPMGFPTQTAPTDFDDPMQINRIGVFASVTDADGKTHLKPLLTALTHPVVMGTLADGRKSIAPVIDGLESGFMVSDGSPVFYSAVFAPTSPGIRMIVVRKAADEQVLYANNDLDYNITVQRISEHLVKITFKKPLKPGRYAIASSDFGPYYAFEVPGKP